MGPTRHHLLPPSSSSQPASAPLHPSPAALCAPSPGVTWRGAGRTAGARGGGRRRGADGVLAAALSLCAPKSGRATVFLSSAAPPPSLTGCGTSASRRPLPPGRSLAGARPLQPAGPSSAAGGCELPYRRVRARARAPPPRVRALPPTGATSAAAGPSPAGCGRVTGVWE